MLGLDISVKLLQQCTGMKVWPQLNACQTHLSPCPTCLGEEGKKIKGCRGSDQSVTAGCLKHLGHHTVLRFPFGERVLFGSRTGKSSLVTNKS